MNKRDPNRVVDEFQILLVDSMRIWRALCDRTGWEAELSKALSVDGFLRAAVGWETFRSDWYVAAINKDASAFRSDLESRFRKSVEGNWPSLSGRISVEIPKHPNLGVVRELVDSRGYNVSFGPPDTWVEKGRRELMSPYRDRVTSLSAPDLALIQSVGALRDCIAHRSPASTETLDFALKKLIVAPDAPLRRGPNRVQPPGIGTYLFALKGRHRRVEIFHRRLNAISERMRV
jgi:hypothetical protein